jgi:hypothetical protein
VRGYTYSQALLAIRLPIHKLCSLSVCLRATHYVFHLFARVCLGCHRLYPVHWHHTPYPFVCVPLTLACSPPCAFISHHDTAYVARASDPVNRERGARLARSTLPFLNPWEDCKSWSQATLRRESWARLFLSSFSLRGERTLHLLVYLTALMCLLVAWYCLLAHNMMAVRTSYNITTHHIKHATAHHAGVEHVTSQPSSTHFTRAQHIKPKLVTEVYYQIYLTRSLTGRC